MAQASPRVGDLRISLSVARQLIVDAIAHLDAAGAPADIAAHLDFALHRIDKSSRNINEN